jgi:hypothetical protein
MSNKLHNPKSHAPAVYIPCWLIQVPVKLLSHAAKLIYGRLSQWCNETGKVYRSSRQLSEEMGTSISSVEKYLKELKDCGLIGTFHPQAGGVNHFEFYDHDWMRAQINDNLSYKSNTPTPPYDLTVPPVKSYGTPPYDLTDINIKEIKEIKPVGEDPPHTQSKSKTPKELAEKKAVGCQEIKALFESRFCGLDVTIEELFESCREHYEQKSLWATRDKFLKWVKNEKLENYEKIEKKSSSDPSRPSVTDFQEYHAKVKGYEWVGEWIKNYQEGKDANQGRVQEDIKQARV